MFPNFCIKVIQGYFDVDWSIIESHAEPESFTVVVIGAASQKTITLCGYEYVCIEVHAGCGEAE